MKYFPRRYLMVSGTFLLALLVLIDRACISVAKESITFDLNLSEKQFGWVLSVFALGYALFQTPSGILADKFGPRKILTAVVSFWSLFTAITGAAFNYTSMLIIRFLFGIGEAGAFPGMARSIFSWIPVKERGIVNGINFSGGRLGVAFSLAPIAWLIDKVGWRSSFLILGGIGVLFAALWYLFFRDDPLKHPGISKQEKEYIQNTRQVQKENAVVEKLSLAQLFSSKNMWLAMGQYFCSNFTFFFCLTWLYPYLKETFALEAVEAGLYSSLPLIAGAVGNWFSGFLVDFIYKRTGLKKSRHIPAILGFSLASLGLVISLYMLSAWTAVIFLSLAIFGADMTLSPSWSVCVDIGKKNSGAVSGTMNMAGNIGSFVTALAFPYLRAWFNSTTPFFFIGAGLNIIAIIIWLRIKPEKAMDEY